MSDSPKRTNKVIYPIVAVLVLLNLSFLALVGWPMLRSGSFKRPVSQVSPRPSNTPVVTVTPLPPTLIPTLAPTLPPDIKPVDGLRRTGVIILSMRDGNYMHLFAYHPQFLPLTRLTNSPWDDIEPSVSPDGSRIAFSSHKNGYWDIYILDLTSGRQSRVTDTPTYDGSPSWSPDGQWLTYESYVNNNMEIMVRSAADLSQPPIQLTNGMGSNHSPTWSPGGRIIAFVSNRTGDDEIWLASLDQVNNRFTNISNSPTTNETHPAWSPDGQYLAWSSDNAGLNSLVIWDSKNQTASLRPAGSGIWPVWSPNGDSLVSEISGSNQVALADYSVRNGQMVYPLTQMPGTIDGLAWKAGKLPDLLGSFKLPANATMPFPSLWQPALNKNPMPPNGRFGVIQLNDVTAPYPYLNDATDESFRSLRAEASKEAGWDVLGNLENAYLPLTEPPLPGMEENWLYTGRAFALNSMATSAGWMVVVRENVEGQTYWRVYLKARYQDGSFGRPITSPTWDMNTRYSGNTTSYEDGGSLGSIPSGYWIDFTEMAYRYGWERLAALTNWRTYYPSTLFNEFVLRGGLDWHAAMAELYPPEALVTSTMVPTNTATITPTPTNYIFQTSTPTPTITDTPTLHPTWTAAP
ncbi:MAG: hypothetical protein P4L50_20500 [Anaerolineaceae bacterium]|nr:hypothetical protein [Anaerolineaceae bacterium]